MTERLEDLEARVEHLEAELAKRKEAEVRVHRILGGTPLFWGGMLVQQPVMFVGRLLDILRTIVQSPLAPEPTPEEKVR